MKSGIVSISTIFFSCLIFSQGNTQSIIYFKQKSKISSSLFGRGYTSTAEHILLSGRDNYVYYLYTFSSNTWDKIRLTSKHGTGESANVMEYLPQSQKIITFGKSFIEIIDSKKLTLNEIEVDGALQWSCGSAVYQDKIYLFGGLWSGVSQREKKWNGSVTKPITQDILVSFDGTRFNELAPLPDKRHTKGKFVNGKLFVIGGESESKKKDILVYDPETNKWSFAGFLPHSVTSNALASDGNLIYLTGVNEESGYLGIYNPTTNLYKEFKTNLKFFEGGLVVRNNVLYFFGGISANDPRVLNNKLFTLELNTLPDTEVFNCSGN